MSKEQKLLYTSLNDSVATINVTIKPASKINCVGKLYRIIEMAAPLMFSYFFRSLQHSSSLRQKNAVKRTPKKDCGILASVGQGMFASKGTTLTSKSCHIREKQQTAAPDQKEAKPKLVKNLISVHRMNQAPCDCTKQTLCLLKI